MKVMTILGTRPEIIRLSLIIKKLDQLTDQHILVHTGQNFTYQLSDVFFDELKLRKPDYLLHQSKHSLGQQLGVMFQRLESILLKEKPDRVLVLGDTNSALSAMLVERMGIPVVHMEAGNRCFDRQVPEEINRRMIDAVATVNLPYTVNSKNNLLKEGHHPSRIMVSGNPIYEVIQNYQSAIDQSQILKRLKLIDKDYFLVTAHRAETVDHQEHLKEIFNALNDIAETYQKRLICSIHPRTKSKLEKIKDIQVHPLVEFYEPFGFFDFIKLEQHAFCVLSDSGTVQEECCIFHVPTVTMRNTTERPETVECGSNLVSGVKKRRIVESVHVMAGQRRDWECPKGYTDSNVSDKVVKLILGGLGFV
ncbi:non-hydrolyzing UDP-N-acetylglucosamine 2-epimerase [Scopulibacillus cellulosilyticus]|uniref:Non-hydrolyzing UDP-N-acetylglucosamine 2-epimerase n=1 Tax=Scopulibacillus cellulosilyticus TaxID=2665665 RepID=A0ABW2PYA9_9BACL